MKLIVNAEKCVGCRICELACSFFHENKFNYRKSRIRIVKRDRYGMDFPVACMQCRKPPCLESCPVSAIELDETTHLRILAEKCIGCGACVDTCPFGAINLPANENIPIVCDLCEGDPACVKKCPVRGVLVYSNKADAEIVSLKKRVEYAKKAFRRIIQKWSLSMTENT